MPILDVFNTNPFSAVSMTAAIQKLPHLPTRIRDLGLFRVEGVTTTSVAIEYANGSLKLLESKTRGGPHNQRKSDKRNVRSFSTIHLPVDDVVLPDEIQNVRQFGSDDAVRGVAQVVSGKLQVLRNDVESTVEHLRAGALKGVILDGDGTTELFDLYDIFNLTEKSINFELGTTGTDVRAKCLELARHVETQLGAASYQRIHALCSQQFFDALIAHPKVQTAYERWESGRFLRDDPRYTGFTFGGITFEEYRGSVNGVKFIPDNTARFFPVGVPNLFIDYRAPGDFMSAVNTVGQDMYARSIVRHDDSGVDLMVESNPLPICTRPEVLVKGTVAA